jgi:hypothetical protein
MMDTMHPDLAHIDDQSLINKITAKRREEADRRQRFFDVKARAIGLDTATLERQLEEKRQMQEAEKNLEAAHAHSAILCDQVAMVCEDEKQMQARARQRETVEFSKKHLRKENRREYALSDPDHLKKDRPAREGDDDPRCGAASIQKFAGEEIEKDRTIHKKDYQNLQKQWLLEQMEEKKAIAEAEREKDAAYDSQVIMATHIRGVMDTHIETTKRVNKKAEADYNLNLAAEHRSRRADKVNKEAEQSALHVTNVMNDPKLHESAGGIKGLTPQQKMDCYEYNLAQMQHKRNVKQAEKEEEFQHAKATEEAVAVLGAIEHKKAELDVQRRRMMDQENSVIAQAQRNMQQQLKNTYQNNVSGDYFNKFNSTAR